MVEWGLDVDMRGKRDMDMYIYNIGDEYSINRDKFYIHVRIPKKKRKKKKSKSVHSEQIRESSVV